MTRILTIIIYPSSMRQLRIIFRLVYICFNDCICFLFTFYLNLTFVAGYLNITTVGLGIYHILILVLPLAQPYRPSQIELRSKTHVEGWYGGWYFPVSPSPAVDLALEKKTGNICKNNLKIKNAGAFLHILPDSNQNLAENTAKTLNYPFSYT